MTHNSDSTNRLNSIVLNTEFKNDPKLWINPSLFSLSKDEKRIKKAISIIDASIKFEDIIIFADNNASYIPNTDFVITADGVYSKERSFLAFEDIKKAQSKSFGALVINDRTYSLSHTKSFNINSVAKIIQEYVSGDKDYVEPDIDKLTEQAKNQNITEKSFVQKLAKGVLIFFFSIFLISFLINLPDMLSYQEERAERTEKREAKLTQENEIAKQKEREREENKKILEAKLAQSVGQEYFDRYNQLTSLSSVSYLLQRDSSWANHVSLYQAKSDFTYKIDNIIDSDVNVKIKKYAYVIYAKEKDDKIIYLGKKYETDVEQLSKNCSLVFQRSSAKNFANYFAKLDKEVLMIRSILSNVTDVDMAIVKSEYIEPQEKMMKKIRYHLETSEADKFMDSIKMGDVIMTLVGALFIFYFISILRKLKLGALSSVGSKVGSAIGDGLNGLKGDKDDGDNKDNGNKNGKKDTNPEDDEPKKSKGAFQVVEEGTGTTLARYSTLTEAIDALKNKAKAYHIYEQGNFSITNCGVWKNGQKIADDRYW